MTSPKATPDDWLVGACLFLGGCLALLLLTLWFQQPKRQRAEWEAQQARDFCAQNCFADGGSQSAFEVCVGGCP